MTMVPGFLPVFYGYEYEYWSAKMKTVLKARDLWNVVESGIEQEPPHETDESEWDVVESGIEKEPRQKTHDESEEESYAAAESYKAYWKKCMEIKDATALHLIHSAVSVDIFTWIATATSAKEAWELLMVGSVGGPMFQSRLLVDLKKEYMSLKMGDFERIRSYTWRVMDLVFRMRSYGWKVEDKEVVKKILSSLSPRFTNVLVEVSETLSITALIDCLLVHEYNMGPLFESVKQSDDVEEIFQEDAESLRTQSHESLMEKQMEVLSLAQQNQMTLVQLQNQMKVLMQQQQPQQKPQKPQQQEQMFGKYDMTDYSKISWSF